LSKEDFRLLFDKYFDSVRSYLVYRGADKEQASDLAQDVFLRVWEKKIDIDMKSASGLLYKIAGDMFISRYRREKLDLNYRTTLTGPDFDCSTEDHVLGNEMFENYTKALASMNEKQRSVFLMARMEGLKYYEIADRLQLSVKAVEKRMSLALNFLRKALQV
jgi:RNA polymerase sigma-70 factor (ECF subfamily)